VADQKTWCGGQSGRAPRNTRPENREEEIVENNETKQVEQTQEPTREVGPPEDKRRRRFKRARINLLIAAVLLVVLIVLYNMDIGGLIWAIVDVAFVVYLIIGIVNLVGGLIAKRS
jgi:hypothetical protein